jgi:uncharacterized membrane protein YhaH (DUF805 family)
MYCKNCGKQLPEGAAFCMNCGTAVEAAPAPATEPAVEPVVEPVVEPKKVEAAAPKAEQPKTEKKLPPIVVAMKTCFLDKYADFSGRTGRTQFWWWYLVCVAVCWIPYLGWIASLALIVPQLSAGARRLHDVGESALKLLFLLIPFFGFFVMLIWWTKPSVEGPNEYGPQPEE